MPVIEVVWKRLEAWLTPVDRAGRPFGYDRRVVLDAIVVVMQSGNGWRSLASEFSPWQTVYAQFKQWEKTGIWDAIWADYEQPCACARSNLQQLMPSSTSP